MYAQASFRLDAREVAIIGQGTWFIDEAERDDAIASLRLGLILGMTHIDTAEYYGSGAAEKLVGEAIASRRNDVFLVSKVVPENASIGGTIKACERSLMHLQTDRLDCFLLHWRGPYPLEDTFDAFERLRAAGKILSWGVSNFDVDDLEDAIAVAGEGRIACNQVLYKQPAARGWANHRASHPARARRCRGHGGQPRLRRCRSRHRHWSHR